MLEGAEESLLLEAGIPMPSIRKAVKDWNKVSGCLITHRHGDHAKSIKDIYNIGIDIYGPQDIFDANGLNNNNPIVKEKAFKVGGFDVIAFDAFHDVPCFSYLIRHKEMGKLLFITDTASCNYCFCKVNNIMIECNHSTDIINNNIQNGTINHSVAERTMQTHFSLESAKYFLQVPNLLIDVRNIILLHLSDKNSNPERFQREIAELTKKHVLVAQKGLEIEL